MSTNIKNEQPSRLYHTNVNHPSGGHGQKASLTAWSFAPILCLLLTATAQRSAAQSPVGFLEQQLLGTPAAQLAKQARELGDAKRGAIVFYQPYASCTQCHTAGKSDKPLGPDLTKLAKDANDVHLVESVLQPSKVIQKGYEPISILTDKGKTIVGLLAADTPDQIQLRDANNNGRVVTILKSQIDEKRTSKTSIMPAGLVNQLTSKQQFLDLVKYLIEIKEGGATRAQQLLPPPAAYAARPLPEYEKRIDHAGMIAKLDNKSFARGKAIYQRLCINCHGTANRPGSLPTSLKFAKGKFKNGSDPFTMYQTLTRGFGMMVPQTWMVPEQKYDVIHYIREEYLKKQNPEQYFAINNSYLTKLPKGDTRGPKPSNIQPWINMDYGHTLIASYETGNDASNFAYKGIAFRLDAGPGGVSRGRYWMIFDHDTMRWSTAWHGSGFIDWNGIMLNGRHGIHPRVVGSVDLQNKSGPGWAEPGTSSFEDVRMRGRDDRPYGPFPRKWMHYKGLYHHGDRAIVSYTVGNSKVLEMPALDISGSDSSVNPRYLRTINIGARDKDLTLQVADEAGGLTATGLGQARIFVGSRRSGKREPAVSQTSFKFDGRRWVHVQNAADLDMATSDFSLLARIKTRRDGSIFTKATLGKWAPDGKSLFIRDGRLTYDIGWVGAIRSKKRINDNRWHDVALTFSKKNGELKLYVDGRLEAKRKMQPKSVPAKQAVKLGYTSEDFPNQGKKFRGQIEHIAFYQRELNESNVATKRIPKDAKAVWRISDGAGVTGNKIKDVSGKRVGAVITSTAGAAPVAGGIVAGVHQMPKGAKWELNSAGNRSSLRLKIPAGKKPLQFIVWTKRANSIDDASKIAALTKEDAVLDLEPLTHGGPARWPTELKTQTIVGKEEGPFQVDVLVRPAANPWSTRVRFTGIDFLPNGNEAIVCAWDGDVWHLEGLQSTELTWRRIASGLFQPLGVRIIGGKDIYVTCRDQLVVLEDLNQDGEIDFYRSFNSDHQVTEHFHEFAMGLQTDDEGNFYYAKSARHAKTALVPHHGTLLKVSKDGTETEILATGFRAANGVCLNPDGSFIVTDQEGHWNPKNRINWVKKGGFYGNMFGYHDVTDSSDSAMEQPLCWITNSFDRSPSELLWVNSKKWGPLNGSLLNFSYGYGQVYVVPHETINNQVQGGMCSLPLKRFPTGVMRGRFHDTDGQLYTCGMFAWAGNQQQPGGLYRIRYTGKPVHLPVELRAEAKGMRIKLSGKVNPQSVTKDHVQVKTWSLKRTANYGSKHYNERSLKVESVTLDGDGQTIFVELPEIKPTWSMEIRYQFEGIDGEQVNGTVHNTIHNLSPTKR